MNTPSLNRFSPALRRTAALGLVGITLTLGGCVVYPAGHGYGYSSGAVVTGPVVQYAPPAPRVEVVGVAPFVGAIWVPGNWVWRDRWAWHEGYWAHPPRPHAQWAPGRWHRDNDGWRWNEGRWR